MIKKHRLLITILTGGGSTSFSDDFNRADGAIGGEWTGANYTIASNAAICTPTLGSTKLVNGNMETGDPPTTWSARGSAPSNIGIIQRPETHNMSGGIILHGREYISASEMYSIVWFSSDNGASWIGKFRPDTTAHSDCGYTALLQRADNTYYMLSYQGSITAANLQELIFT